MAASYPSSTKTFSTKAGGGTVEASHVNDLQDEVVAIETDLRAGLPIARGGTGATTAAAARAALGMPDGVAAFRNRLVSGDMRIDQRNAGVATNPANGDYVVDRWSYGATQASKFSGGQNYGAVAAPAGFTHNLGMVVGAAVGVGAADVFHVTQAVEGSSLPDLKWGTADAAAVTLSFWARSSIAGLHSGAIRNAAATRSYPFTFTIGVANTWEHFTITIPGDTAGTWPTGAVKGLDVTFSLGAGSNYSGTASAWAASNYVAATGAVSVVGTLGASFYLTGVQLEAGSVATTFEQRPLDDELRRCQRYCYVTANNIVRVIGQCYSAVLAAGTLFLPVTMRATPTVTYKSAAGANYTVGSSVGAGINTTAVGAINLANNAVLLDWTVAAGLTAGHATMMTIGGNGIWITAEL
jgi:hypothetical protein